MKYSQNICSALLKPAHPSLAPVGLVVVKIEGLGPKLGDLGQFAAVFLFDSLQL